MLTFLIVLGLERVVEVGTKQPCFTFRGKLVRAFTEGHLLAMHVRHARVDRGILVERVGCPALTQKRS